MKLDAIPEARLWRHFWHDLPQIHTEYGVDAVLNRAMADGSFSYDEVWFGDMQVPPIDELARHYGNTQSLRIHSDSFSIRDLWIR